MNRSDRDYGWAVPDADLTAAAVKTYLYGYPLVYNLVETQKLLDGTSPLLQGAQANRFAAARDLLGPDAAFVSPNNDTCYLMAGCDLRDGPLLLSVPDAHDRYYVLQFVDAWSENFAYIGRRATGTDAQTFVLALVGYDGDLPDGATLVEVPTSIFAIVGRVQVDGVDDLPAVHALQDQFSLGPLNSTPDGTGRFGVPQVELDVPGDLLWWEQFRVSLAAFPPSPADAEFLETAALLGLTGTSSPLVDPDPDLAEALVEGRRRGEATLEELSKTSLKMVDGWSGAMHAFDYNLDHTGIGTVDAPEWKIADRTTAYVTRAVAARLGLWGNHGYEARYDILWQDENGDELDGSHAYELTLDPQPQVDAFWSLTMYDEPDYYLVANEIDRYSIGDRTPGLELGPNDSVTILMQHPTPSGEHLANWLPAPTGKFRPILRSYQPIGPMLTGEYVLPTVRKLEGPK
jgi:hypothetical protein